MKLVQNSSTEIITLELESEEVIGLPSVNPMEHRVELVQMTPNEYYGEYVTYTEIGEVKDHLYFDLFISSSLQNKFEVPFEEKKK